jgi:hypothetical protein
MKFATICGAFCFLLTISYRRRPLEINRLQKEYPNPAIRAVGRKDFSGLFREMCLFVRGWQGLPLYFSLIITHLQGEKYLTIRA